MWIWNEENGEFYYYTVINKRTAPNKELRIILNVLSERDVNRERKHETLEKKEKKKRLQALQLYSAKKKQHLAQEKQNWENSKAARDLLNSK